jgi:hypothetical protein
LHQPCRVPWSISSNDAGGGNTDGENLTLMSMAVRGKTTTAHRSGQILLILKPVLPDVDLPTAQRQKLTFPGDNVALETRPSIGFPIDAV